MRPKRPKESESKWMDVVKHDSTKYDLNGFRLISISSKVRLDLLQITMANRIWFNFGNISEKGTFN